MDSGTADTTPDPRAARSLRSLRLPAVLLGVGFGGFVDGILFHQVLQFHHMLSNAGDDRLGLAARPVDTVAGLEANTRWDGLFHLAAYLFVLVGLLLLWQAWRNVDDVVQRPPWAVLGGGLLAGWGAFNLVEGIVDHHLLQIHHVRPGDLEVLWDVLFLAAGLLFLVGGVRLLRSSTRPARSSRAG